MLYVGMIPFIIDAYGDPTGQRIGGHHIMDAWKAIFPLGFIFVPVIAWSMMRFSLFTNFYIVSAIGSLAYATVIFRDLHLLVPGFVLFTFFRAFLYSHLTEYNAVTFGFPTLGRIQGTMFAVMSLFHPLILPLIDWERSQLKTKSHSLIIMWLLIPVAEYVLIQFASSTKNPTTFLQQGKESLVKEAESLESLGKRL